MQREHKLNDMKRRKRYFNDGNIKENGIRTKQKQKKMLPISRLMPNVQSQITQVFYNFIRNVARVRIESNVNFSVRVPFQLFIFPFSIETSVCFNRCIAFKVDVLCTIIIVWFCLSFTIVAPLPSLLSKLNGI